MSTKKTFEAIAEERIAVRAYERWMGRGCPATDGVEDWLAARGELEAETGTKKKSVPRKPAAPKSKPSAPISMH